MSDFQHRLEVLRLKVELRDLKLKLAKAELDRGVRTRCRLCNGIGSIPGFLLGTTKTCTSCHGSGHQ